MFDHGPLVSCAGLVPVMTLADRTRLRSYRRTKITIAAPRHPGIAEFLAQAGVIAGMYVGKRLNLGTE